MTQTVPDPRPAAPRDDDPLAERRVEGAQVYRGALLDVRRDVASMPDGSEAVREYVVHPGAVLVLPVRDDGRIVVERQFRYPHNRSFLELPAGKLDPGESALDTGARELAEEAGFAAQVWIRLGVIHPVIAYSTEAIFLYEARGLTHVGARLDAGEFLELLDLSEADLWQAIEAERLTDAKSVAALALHARWQAAASRSVRLRITGRVQGVGYRDFAIREASAAGLAGWVRNRVDGSVEAHVQGPREICDRFVEACRRGPRAGRVDRIEVERAAPIEALRDFGQRRTE